MTHSQRAARMEENGQIQTKPMLPRMIIFLVFHQNCINQWNFIIAIIGHFANHLKIRFRVDTGGSLSDWSL